MSAPAIVVTGTGMITPVGTDTDSTWEAVLRGESRAGLAPLAGVAGDRQARTVAPFGAELLAGRGTANLDPFIRYALVVADQAIADAGLDSTAWDGGRVGIVVGCGLGGAATMSTAHSRLAERGPDAVSPYLHPRSLINMAAGMIAIRHHVTGPGHTVVAACASGAVAIGVGRDLIRGGACDIVIAVGTDAGVVPVVAAGFAAMGALTENAADDASRPFAADRSGFVLSEGAAALVLEREDAARERGAPSRGRILGYGFTTDAHHPVAPHPDAVGAEAAVRAALADAGLEPSDVDHVNAHGTSTPYNDASEGKLINRLFPHRPSVTANKGLLGHSLGAAGAIEAVLTLRTLTTGIVPPTAHTPAVDPGLTGLDLVVEKERHENPEVAVSHSFGFGGSNCVLVMGP
ncbi:MULTISPECIES: beta-ketoacyl-[acyl-carrier-protein] synthase family protein [unclassified Streptomyces]|uniref:beta-ketoacyl-[acyl-carrier-protein] synthase family protein n=1 Tax=unclassified Streptomyces TaxID=2593676 RepID=UPI0016614326|nr:MULTISPECIES: beta-ketoacyl-[acyl-carrier-protein] synthase family protein [unclassified Streptomyces]MBD0707491.1 3-oxoacyl-ACP synthase [Streptomyces sp. CBMA291]MBD0714486.1 3-oxoacyl-ACP synthase [Streptomyces sp. CBMA370]